MTDFVTKDSGERQQWESGMMRDVQTGKPRFALVLAAAQPYEDQMLTRYARLLARGAEKYDDRNWEQGDGEKELEYAKESLLRHTMQLITGETDEDHAAAVWFNTQLIEHIRWKQDQYVKDFNEAVADGYADEWLAEYDKEHPETAQQVQRGLKHIEDNYADHSHPGRAGGLYDGPAELTVKADDLSAVPIAAAYGGPVSRIGTWGDERALQDEIERQLSPAAKRNETPFSQAVERFSEAGGFETAETVRKVAYRALNLTEDQLEYQPQIPDLLRAEQEAAERLLARTEQRTFPIVPAPNPVQLGLDRDQRNR